MCLGPFCSWLGKMKLLHSFGGNLIDGPCSPWLSMTVHLVSHFDEMLLPISRCVWSCMRLSDIAGPVFRTFCYKPTVHNAPLNKKEVTGLHEEFLTLQCSLRESCTSLNCIPIISSHTHVHPTQVVAHSCLKATKPLICIHGVGASVQCFLDLSSVEERMDRGQQDLGPLTSSSTSFSLFLSHMGTSKMDMGFELHQSPVMISDVGFRISHPGLGVTRHKNMQ